MISLLLRGQQPSRYQVVSWVMALILYIVAFNLMNEELYKEMLIGVLFMAGANIMDSANAVS